MISIKDVLTFVKSCQISTANYTQHEALLDINYPKITLLSHENCVEAVISNILKLFKADAEYSDLAKAIASDPAKKLDAKNFPDQYITGSTSVSVHTNPIITRKDRIEIVSTSETKLSAVPSVIREKHEYQDIFDNTGSKHLLFHRTVTCKFDDSSRKINLEMVKQASVKNHRNVHKDATNTLVLSLVKEVNTAVVMYKFEVDVDETDSKILSWRFSVASMSHKSASVGTVEHHQVIIKNGDFYVNTSTQRKFVPALDKSSVSVMFNDFPGEPGCQIRYATAAIPIKDVTFGEEEYPYFYLPSPKYFWCPHRGPMRMEDLVKDTAGKSKNKAFFNAVNRFLESKTSLNEKVFDEFKWIEA